MKTIMLMVHLSAVKVTKMIRTEELTINGRSFTRTWSNAGKYVVREGISYSEAYDPAEFGRTYTEGDVIENTGTENLWKEV